MNIPHNIPRQFHENIANRTPPLPLAAMCRTEPGFQNGDCPNDVELGNRDNETQIIAFKETIDVLSECHFTKNMLFIRYAEAWELT